MVDQLLNTVTKSLQDIVGSSIKIIPALLIGLVIIFLTRYAARFIQNLVIQVTRRTIRSRSLQLLLAKTSHVATWVIGVLMACVIAFPGLRLGDLVATLGLSSVAIGFAFQDIFKNFLAGILLLLQEPFKIDDQIIIGDYEGTVEKIDVRTTKIRTYQGEQVLLPNSTVFTSAVQVRTAFSSRRTDLAVGVDYNTSLKQAMEILESTISQVEGVLDSPEPEIDVVNFGDSSIDFIVRYWTKSQQKSVRTIQTKVMISIKSALDKAEISIPYPIRTLYFYNQDQYNDDMPDGNHKASSQDNIYSA
ncbi:MAG: mechanosensitive ion channel family protein [Microcoleaceae cyanobacterium]